jgi:hypothetical protein
MLLVFQLPAWISFLSLGWFIWHALAISTVFYLGVQTGRRYRPQAGSGAPVEPPKA